MTKQVPTIRIKHRDDTASLLEGPLAGTIKLLQDILGTIPEACRGSAYMSIDTYDDYGSPSTTLEIHYERPMTPEEVAVDKLAKRAFSAKQLARDRAELARLKAKLGE